jgi:hypothetical protein
MSGAESRGRSPPRAIGETRWVEDPSGESRSVDATRADHDSLRGELRSVNHSRATGETTRSRRTPRTREGQPARGRTDGAPKQQTHRREADGRRLREVEGFVGNDGASNDGSSRSSSPTSSDAGGQRNGKRGAGRSDAARLPTRSKPSQGGAPAGKEDPAREASASTTDPTETWRTQTRYRLQHAGSRERRKPSRW